MKTRSGLLVLSLMVGFCLVLGACGTNEEADLTLLDENIEVLNNADTFEPMGTFCGYVTCPWLQNYTNCTNRDFWALVSRCVASACGNIASSGCPRYNSSSCLYNSFAGTSPYCGGAYTLKCRYTCFNW